MTQTKELTASDFESSLGPDIVPIELPEMGGHVYMRVVSENEIAASGMLDKSDPDSKVASKEAMICFLKETLCDHEGNPIFANGSADVLYRLRPIMRMRLFNAAMRHNGLTAEAQAELEGKSETMPANGSGSA